MIVPIDFDAFIILVFSIGTISGLSFCALTLEIINAKKKKHKCPPPPSIKNDDQLKYKSELLSALPIPKVNTIMPLPPAPSEENTIKVQYVTLTNGQRPKEPVSFFHTKKFLGIGAVFAVIAGYVLYLLIIA